MNMKVLIVGTGWIGSKLYSTLTLRNHEVHICSHKEALNIVSSTTFDWVINCAGVTGIPNIDACELDKTETYLGNTLFPIALWDSISRTSTRLGHFSSGCIYDGVIDSLDTLPNFFENTYSISKGLSDTFLKTKAQVYRIHMPFTSTNEPKNLLTKIIKYSKVGKLFDGGKNSITDLDEAILIVSHLIETNAPAGPYNLVNKGSVTMKEIAEILEVTPMWSTEEEFKLMGGVKRSNSVIPAYPDMRPIRMALIDATNKLLDKSNKTN